MERESLAKAIYEYAHDEFRTRSTDTPFLNLLQSPEWHVLTHAEDIADDTQRDAIMSSIKDKLRVR